MQLPKNYFTNLSTARYKEYLKLLPKIKNDNSKAITMLILTFLAMGFLGIFAINPTLTTIVELNKQLEESKFVYEQLTAKIENLSSLQSQYKVLNNDLPYVFDAIPQSPDITVLIGQIETMAQQQNVTINALRIDEVQLSKILKPDKDSLMFSFVVDVEGGYNQMINFSSSLIDFNRMLTIDNISLSKNNKNGLLILSIKGKGYFKQ